MHRSRVRLLHQLPMLQMLFEGKGFQEHRALESQVPPHPSLVAGHAMTFHLLELPVGAAALSIATNVTVPAKSSCATRGPPAGILGRFGIAKLGSEQNQASSRLGWDPLPKHVGTRPALHHGRCARWFVLQLPWLGIREEVLQLVL